MGLDTEKYVDNPSFICYFCRSPTQISESQAQRRIRRSMDLSGLYKKGMEAFERRNYDYAVQMYSQILELQPNSPDAFKYLRATALKREEGGGKMSKTSSLFGAAKSKGFVLAKKWDKAFSACVKTLSTSPRDVANFMMLGDSAYNLGHLEIAVAAYIAVTELGPNFDAYFNLAQIYRDQEDFAKAQESADRARQLNPTNRDLAKFMKDLSAVSFQASSNIEKVATSARGDFKEGLRNQGQAEELIDDAKILRTDEEIDAALKRAMRDYEENPSDKKLCRKVADLHWRKKQYKTAKEWFQKVLELDEGDSQSRDKMGDCDIVMHELNYKKKLALFQKAKTAEAKAEAQKARNNFLLVELREYQRRVKFHPSDLRLKYLLGEKYFAINKTDEAVSMFQQSVKDPKIKLESQHRLGQCFTRKGLHDLAIGQFEAALKELPLFNELKKNVLYELADCQEKAGKRADAKKNFADIYQNDISYKDVSKRLENLKEV